MRRTVEEEAVKYDLLVDPRRRRIYLALRRAGNAMTKDEVAASVGISRSLATFHLEKLLEGGFLEAHFAHSATEPSRGMGRPAKYYLPSGREVALGIPPRRYDVAAEILTRAVATGVTSASPADRALGLAHARGREAGEQFMAEEARGRRRGATRGEVERLLGELGYEPRSDGSAIVLGNCPFDALVFPPYLICEMNGRLVQGALEGCKARGLQAVEEWAEGQCCVVVTRRAHSSVRPSRARS